MRSTVAAFREGGMRRCLAGHQRLALIASRSASLISSTSFFLKDSLTRVAPLLRWRRLVDEDQLASWTSFLNQETIRGHLIHNFVYHLGRRPGRKCIRDLTDIQTAPLEQPLVDR